MKRNFSKIIFLILALALVVVPVLALGVSAEGETVTFNVPLGIDDIASLAADADGNVTLPRADAPADYTFEGWTKAPINEAVTTAPTIYAEGDTYNVSNGTALYAVYSITEAAGSGSGVKYALYSGELTAGNYIIVYGGGAMNTTVSSSRLGYTPVTIASDEISSENADASIIWTIEASGDYWTIYNESAGKYAASTGVKNKAQLLASGTDDKSLWTASGTATYEFVNKANKAAGINSNLRRNGDYGFACYATGTGGALSLYKETAGSASDITWYSTMTAYNATFVSNGVQIDSGKDFVTFPDGPVVEGNYAHEYTFAGWATAEAEDSTTKPELFAAGSELSLTSDTIFYAVYTYSVENENATSYTKADISDIADGSTVILTSTKGTTSYALLDSNGTSSAPTAVAIDDINNISEPDDNITWIIHKVDGGYSFETAAETGNYLYCTATNNGVRVGTNANNVFVVEGTYNYLFNVATNRYVGVYNNADWRCYTPVPTGNSNIANQIFAIYTISATSNYYTSTLISAEDNVTKLSGASLTLGADLAMNYYVAPKAGASLAGYYMVFNFNGKDTTVDVCAPAGNEYIFSFPGIQPQQMDETITATLFDADDNVVDSLVYSVAQHADDLLEQNPDNTKLATLVNAMLVYGDAAENFIAGGTNEIPELNGPSGPNVRELGESTTEGLNFTAVGVNFDYCNRVYAKFVNTAGLEGVTVDVTIDNKTESVDIVEIDGGFIVYSKALTAKQFHYQVKFELKDGENNVVQTLKYSVNDYVYAKMDSTTPNLANLVLALYRYGVAAKNY